MPTPDTTVTLLSPYQRDKTGWGLQFLPAIGTLYANPNGRIPTNRFTGEQSWDKYDNTTVTTGYLFEHRVDDIWTIRQNARYAHLENEQQGVFGLGFADPNQRLLARYGDYGKSKLDSFTIDNQLQGKFTTGPLRHTLLVGLDYQHHRFSDLGGVTYPVPPLDLFNPTYGLPSMMPDPAGVYQDSTQKQGRPGSTFRTRSSLTAGCSRSADARTGFPPRRAIISPRRRRPARTAPSPGASASAISSTTA
jgi:iron complex outermembrane receptor protein